MKKKKNSRLTGLAPDQIAQALSALRNKKLSPQRRQEIARAAAAARWAQKTQAAASD